MKSIKLIPMILFGILFTSCDVMLPAATYPVANQGSGYYVTSNFAGNYNNQGDANRSSNFTISLSQSGDHLSGTARNSSANGDDSGLLSVDGNVDGDVANLQFFDQRGYVIATGVLSHNQGAYTFIQNSTSTLIPAESYMYRTR